jgi:hypothetical protein
VDNIEQAKKPMLVHGHEVGKYKDTSQEGQQIKAQSFT